MHSSGWMYSIVASANSASSLRGWMQSTGHTSTQAVSLVSIHGSVMIKGMLASLRFGLYGLFRWPAPHGGAFWPKSSDYTLQRSLRCNSVVHRERRGARMARRDDREYREYLSEEQRQPGCIVVRMPMELHR